MYDQLHTSLYFQPANAAGELVHVLFLKARIFVNTNEA